MWSETLGHRDFRPPYLPQFFSDVARQIPLLGHEALLDLGCGTGSVAFGFARYVESLTGLDLELPMLETARERARLQGIAIRLVHARAEEAPSDLENFHLITIGQAHWFIHSPATLARIERWLLPGGHVLLCRPISRAVGGAKWHDEFHAIRGHWARGDLAARMRLSFDDFFAGTEFQRVRQIVVLAERSVGLEDLVHRALGTADTSRAMLGADADRMIAEIRERLGPYFSNGPVVEQLGTAGLLYRRRGDL